MVTEISQGVKVSVLTQYQEEYSSPAQYHYVFSYKVRIENVNDFTIQLLRRQWFIYDANGTVREVEGEGVIGQQPFLEPGDVYEYVSGCNLKSGMGKMNGNYLFERVVDEKEFRVSIPEFNMVVPFKLN